jgi:hypothetical protein
MCTLQDVRCSAFIVPGEETDMGFKTWLRGPADDPRVEVIGEHAWYWDSTHYSQRKNRSVMRGNDDRTGQ